MLKNEFGQHEMINQDQGISKYINTLILIVFYILSIRISEFICAISLQIIEDD